MLKNLIKNFFIYFFLIEIQDDGSFKIETRDLQGNVKQGTYGYIDEHGEVKRVSYSTQNNTLFKDYKPPQLQQQTTSVKAVVNEENEENETISPASSLRYNRTFVATTRRPSSLAYLTSTNNPSTKSSVVQTIPKLPKRRISISEPNIQQSLLSTETSKIPIEGTTTVIYATSVPTPKPYLSRSTTSPNYSSLNNNKKVSAVTEKGVEIDQIEIVEIMNVCLYSDLVVQMFFYLISLSYLITFYRIGS